MHVVLAALQIVRGKYFWRVAKWKERRNKISDKTISNIRYADGNLIIVSSQQELQRIMNKVVETGRECGLLVNAGKTECICSRKKQRTVEYTSMVGDRANFLLSDILAQFLKKTACTRKKSDRTEQARSAFIKIKNLLVRYASVLRYDYWNVMYSTFSIVAYGSESWTFNPAWKKRLVAF